MCVFWKLRVISESQVLLQLKPIFRLINEGTLPAQQGEAEAGLAILISYSLNESQLIKGQKKGGTEEGSDVSFAVCLKQKQHTVHGEPADKHIPTHSLGLVTSVTCWGTAGVGDCLKDPLGLFSPVCSFVPSHSAS